MLTFAAAVFFLIITPGPGVLSTAGVGAAFGPRTGARYVLGLFLGTNMVALAVVSGLAAIVLANANIRNVLFGLSTCYLLYLAFRIARAGSRLAFKSVLREPGVIDGVLLQMVNPKAYAVNTTLFSGFAIFPNALMAETMTKFLIINLIWIPIHFLWLWMGIRLQQLDISDASHRRINIAMSLSMLMVVALAVVGFFVSYPGTE